MKSWQVFSYAMHELPKGTLQRIYTRSSRLVYLWSANPRFAQFEKNPIDRIGDMIEELCAAGRRDVAEAAVDILAERIGGRFSSKGQVAPDKDMPGEALDLFGAVSRLVEQCRAAVEDGAVTESEMDEIKARAGVARAELDQLIGAVEEEHERSVDRVADRRTVGRRVGRA